MTDLVSFEITDTSFVERRPIYIRGSEQKREAVTCVSTYTMHYGSDDETGSIQFRILVGSQPEIIPDKNEGTLAKAVDAFAYGVLEKHHKTFDAESASRMDDIKSELTAMSNAAGLGRPSEVGSSEIYWLSRDVGRAIEADPTRTVDMPRLNDLVSRYYALEEEREQLQFHHSNGTYSHSRSYGAGSWTPRSAQEVEDTAPPWKRPEN
ncbi:hypothetical protein [Brevundimonas sp. SGAir0440]|uniref:hypothetical protein n=1 Tax=Brevundimonas sp. SGAir0440 TaxID=2579977 RepID=UPI0010CD2FEA|nr:hypothetical protein [Brevundimonas sp. SGAir0440]QCQ98511.1 hypothetical protein E7T10_07440 [Brevundimonas sp. SGAir0440]